MATASHGIITSYSAGMANNTVGAIYSAGSGATTTVSPNNLSIRPHQVFVSRLISYTSPNMGGLVINAQYGQNKNDTVSTTDTNAKGSFTDIAAKFDSGKLSLGASYQENKTTANAYDAAAIDGALGLSGYSSATLAGNGTAASSGALPAVAVHTGAGTMKTKTTMFGASYNFGVVQPFALYTEKKSSANTAASKAVGDVLNPSSIGSNGAYDNKIVSQNVAYDTNYKQKAYELGARVPVNAQVMAFASMYDGSWKDSDSKADLTGYQVGATYAMSKRTTVYAITGEQKIKGEGGEFKAKATGTSVGLRHTF
jgi:predicted porin